MTYRLKHKVNYILDAYDIMNSSRENHISPIALRTERQTES